MCVMRYFSVRSTSVIIPCGRCRTKGKERHEKWYGWSRKRAHIRQSSLAKLLEHMVLEDIFQAWSRVAYHIILQRKLTPNHQLTVCHVFNFE
jgi:hypothetical protein